MKLTTATAISALALLLAAPAHAWGPVGHRVTGEIAERNINGRTRANIELILGRQSLVEATTRPDEERSNPDPFWRQEAGPYHFVTLPEGIEPVDLAHPPQGDALTALERFTATLRDPAAGREDKALALWFVSHIVGDLHMPLHAGNGTDRGGNDLRVLWFGEPNNLHWVWDEGLILRQQLSYSEYADRLMQRMAPEETATWWSTDPLEWIGESADLRDRLYPARGGELGEGTPESPVILSWDYSWRWTPPMEQRLQMAGIRLAAYLDWVFAQ